MYEWVWVNKRRSFFLFFSVAVSVHFLLLQLYIPSLSNKHKQIYFRRDISRSRTDKQTQADGGWGSESMRVTIKEIKENNLRDHENDGKKVRKIETNFGIWWWRCMCVHVLQNSLREVISCLNHTFFKNKSEWSTKIKRTAKRQRASERGSASWSTNGVFWRSKIKYPYRSLLVYFSSLFVYVRYFSTNKSESTSSKRVFG